MNKRLNLLCLHFIVLTLWIMNAAVTAGTASKSVYSVDAEFQHNVTVAGSLIVGTQDVTMAIQTANPAGGLRWTNTIGTSLYINVGMVLTNSPTVSNSPSPTGNTSSWVIVNGSLNTNHFSTPCYNDFVNRSNFVFIATSDQSVVSTLFTNVSAMAHDVGTGLTEIHGVLYATAPSNSSVDMNLSFTGTASQVYLTIRSGRVGTNFSLGKVSLINSTSTILPVDLDIGFTNVIYIDGIANVLTANSFHPMVSQVITGTPTNATFIKTGSWLSYGVPVEHSY